MPINEYIVGILKEFASAEKDFVINKVANQTIIINFDIGLTQTGLVSYEESTHHIRFSLKVKRV